MVPGQKKSMMQLTHIMLPFSFGFVEGYLLKQIEKSALDGVVVMIGTIYFIPDVIGSVGFK